MYLECTYCQVKTVNVKIYEVDILVYVKYQLKCANISYRMSNISASLVYVNTKYTKSQKDETTKRRMK